jgi:CRP/FNR family cyclic AMP-dependent transcriptional regulator
MPEEKPFFSRLDDMTIRLFEKTAVRKKYPKNSILLSKGDESDSLYIICSGKAHVIARDEQGKEIVLSVMGPGEYFGEMAALDGGPRSATIVTKEPSEILVIRGNDFRDSLSSNPDLMFNLVRVLLMRLRIADEKIESLAFMNVYGRVTSFLMQSAEPQGDTWIVREALTHQEIADMVGSSRETVSRAIKELQKAGHISIEKKRITIHKELV